MDGRRLRALPLLVAAAAAVVYALLEPHTADVAAAVFRADLFADHGWSVWNPQWYAGHHTPPYSLLAPPLAALVGPWALAAAATVAAVAAFQGIAHGATGPRGPAGPRRAAGSLLAPTARRPAARAREAHARADLAAVAFALTAAANLFAGRVPFGLGLAVGLAALLAAVRGRWGPAFALALLAPLCSPVAAAFLALAGAAWAIDDRGARPALLAAAALAPALVLAVAFPTGGAFPFEAGSFWPAAAFALAALAVVPAGPVRIGLVLWALALVAAFALATPVGGNAVRLGMLFLGPVLVLVARPRAAAWLAVPAVAWAAVPAVRDLAAAAGDPSTRSAYWAPLDHWLVARPGRVEIAFTRNHWEAAHVARRTPLARGWERQLDRRHNALFYDGRLTAARYERWLRGLAIRYVVLSPAELDPSARAEARLIAARPAYLRPVRGAPAGFRIFAVRPAPRPGPAPQRWTRWWHIDGRGCLVRTPGGFAQVRGRGRPAIDLLDPGPRC